MIYDISQTLRPDLPVWPGDTPFSLTETWSMADGSPVTVSKLTLSTHSGAHADAPRHYSQTGAASSDVALDPYIGPAVLIDLSQTEGNIITPEHLQPYAADIGDRVILRLYQSFPHDEWVNDFRSISSLSINFMAERGCKLVGVDTPSLDPQDSKTMDAHKAVLSADMRILEGLVLDDVPPGAYELIALPLKLAGADASPVRAVLRTLDNV